MWAYSKLKQWCGSGLGMKELLCELKKNSPFFTGCTNSTYFVKHPDNETLWHTLKFCETSSWQWNTLKESTKKEWQGKVQIVTIHNHLMMMVISYGYLDTWSYQYDQVSSEWWWWWWWWSQVVILGLVAKLYETQSELDRVREDSDNALALLYNQVSSSSS